MLECDVYIKEQRAKGKVWTDYGFITLKKRKKLQKKLKRYI
tara:strand:- start:787 stop:909 length:123 start_codon:yes stop_codon:yes gene_type:complete